ncbi:hypothetical protein [Pseudonocardia sp. HH130630-07]|uniref:hypothetical protein n=1 Tax=Pseudonocardia sp. HH130630-07 TaxID=1690815 RepID=UPI000814C8A1|nr:hypothetical protein [Pseudonocardia sp. HH130630-07]ANY05056.1 hypothetical protein AFB00_00485 [Pseudonocardia sp. HH130630-07]
MTTTRSLRLRRVLGGVATLATLPYVTMKLSWLTGHLVGVTDPALVAGAGMPAMNVATVLLDLCVIALAVALASRAALRLPALPVLLPAWVATGLLVPIALVSLPLTLAAPPGSGIGLAPWVHPMVYGGFTVQAVCLLGSFAAYARERWWGRVTGPGPVPVAARGLLRALSGGGAVTGVLAAGLHVLAGAPSGRAIDLVATGVTAILVLTGVAGTLRLTGGRSGPVAVLGAWTGSAVAFAGGLYGVVVTMGATALGGAGSAAWGLAQVSSLLSGFALAVAGLLALAGSPSGSAGPAAVPVPDRTGVRWPHPAPARTLG